MGQKAVIAKKLMDNAVYGYAATFGLFSTGYGLLLIDAFKNAANDETTRSTINYIGDTMMYGGLATGVFMAVCANLHKFKFADEAIQELATEAREERLAKFRAPNNDL